MSPIASYLTALRPLLARRDRRRILAEVRAHLHEAAAEGLAGGQPLEAAERRAIARFGAPAEVARQFNALRRRPRRLARQLAAVALTCAASASVGSATVWALEPSGATAHAVAHHHHHHAGRSAR